MQRTVQQHYTVIQNSNEIQFEIQHTSKFYFGYESIQPNEYN